MRHYLCCALALLLLFPDTGFGSSKSKLENGGNDESYIYCNIFLADGCFGLAAGDKLTMEVINDFVLYDIVFSSGGSGRLYSGFNPDVAKDEVKFTACNWKNSFSECRIRILKDRRLEFIARRGPKSTALHLILDKNVSADVAQSFLRNFKPCISSKAAIKCSRF